MTQDSTDAFFQWDKYKIELLFDQMRSELGPAIDDKSMNSLLKEMSTATLDSLSQEFIPEDLSNGIVFLKPKKEYDIILNTETTNPQEAAKVLLEYIENR